MSKNSNKKKNIQKKKISVPKKTSVKKSINAKGKKSTNPKKEKVKKPNNPKPKKEVNKTLKKQKPVPIMKAPIKDKKNNSIVKKGNTKIKVTKSIAENTSTPLVSVRPLTEKPIHDKKGNLIQPVNAPSKIFKLRIDGRTIISVKSKEALRMWKEKYPNAVEEE